MSYSFARTTSIWARLLRVRQYASFSADSPKLLMDTDTHRRRFVCLHPLHTLKCYSMTCAWHIIHWQYQENMVNTSPLILSSFINDLLPLLKWTLQYFKTLCKFVAMILLSYRHILSTWCRHLSALSTQINTESTTESTKCWQVLTTMEAWELERNDSNRCTAASINSFHMISVFSHCEKTLIIWKNLRHVVTILQCTL